MSKIIEELTKLKKEREKQAFSANGPKKERTSRAAWWGILLLFIVITTGSVTVNVMTMADLGRSRADSLGLAGLMHENSAELKALREFIDTERRSYQQELARLNKDMEAMNLVAAKIEDMKINNKLLLEKFVSLNDKVRKISEMSAVTVNSKW